MVNLHRLIFVIDKGSCRPACSFPGMHGDKTITLYESLQCTLVFMG